VAAVVRSMFRHTTTARVHAARINPETNPRWQCGCR